MADHDRTDRRFPEPVRRGARDRRRRSTSKMTADGPRLNLSGEEAELLVRHRGEPLKALQHVVDMAFGREPRRRAARLRRRARAIARARTSSCGRWRSTSPRRPRRPAPISNSARSIRTSAGIVHLAAAEIPGVSHREHRRRVLEDRPHFGAEVAVAACQSRSSPTIVTSSRCSPPPIPSSRLRRRRAAAASASCALSGPRRASHRRRTDRAATRARSRATRRSRRSAPRDLRATDRRRRASIRSSSRTSPRPRRTPATMSSRSARMAAPSCCSAIVDAAIARGARLAEPGEFTLRAFLNGRIDLTQAEAVADLIDAATPLQARAAFDQLNGTLTRRDRRDRRGAVRSDRAARSVGRFSGRGLSLRRSGASSRPSIDAIARTIDALLARRRGAAGSFARDCRSRSSASRTSGSRVSSTRSSARRARS